MYQRLSWTLFDYSFWEKTTIYLVQLSMVHVVHCVENISLNLVEHFFN